MVLICNKTFSEQDQESYGKYFSKFEYELSDFQKHSIKAIVDKKHSLVTAHTGSGKTLPAEFAIQHFVEQGKKVIYTSPIKALSNQKLHDLSAKYPHISFGLLTGDCKHNPLADVLIMTTEILRNTLFQKQIGDTEKEKNILQFTMNMETELGAVIFDEIHYIDDPERGSVWEQSIIMLPNHVQMIMLSATIDKPEIFAEWIEKKKEIEVVLSGTTRRVVPLNHYGFITTSPNMIECIRKPTDKSMVLAAVNKFIPLKKQGEDVNETSYYQIRKVDQYFHTNRIWVPRKNVLNKLAIELKNSDMLPALCFVFSRKNVEVFAKEIDIQLHEEDSTVPSIIANECKQMLVRRLPNWREYVELPEYNTIIKLLEKGIAIHHAGILPIFREMTEMLFEKKYIKLLFATETFAVGINMPTKTVVFSGLSKFNGSVMRDLYSHEYTQMAGRAGRRGIDTVGHVIHCNNMFDYPTLLDYRTILGGMPKKIKSRFKISYNLILNILNSVDYRENKDQGKLIQFVEKSLMQDDIEKEIKNANSEMEAVSKEVEKINSNMKHLSTPLESLKRYHHLVTTLQDYGNKDKKRRTKEYKQMEEQYRRIKDDMIILQQRNDTLSNMDEQLRYKKYAETYIETTISNVLTILKSEAFIDDKEDITHKGICATYMQEIHGLVFAELYIKSEGFKHLTALELVGLFSCFTDTRVKEEERRQSFESSEPNTAEFVATVNEIKYQTIKYQELEAKHKINTGTNDQFQFDLVNYAIEWCEGDNEVICKHILTKLKYDEGIFLGDFIKAILKINNIVKEVEKVSLLLNNVELSHKLQKIPGLTLKHVVTNQSLYVA